MLVAPSTLVLSVLSFCAAWQVGQMFRMYVEADKPALRPWRKEGEDVPFWTRRCSTGVWCALVSPEDPNGTVWSVWRPDGVRTCGVADDVDTALRCADRAAAPFWRLK
jgi:hypothetical protein